jgi:DNA adenine methylase
MFSDLEMPPLIRWPGGQSRTCRKLRGRYPKHKTYVEPFAGGASFFFDKEPSEIEVLGDTSPWLMKFYDQVRKGGARACRKGFTGKESMKGTNACSRLAVSALMYAGFSRGSIDKTRITNGRAYASKLKNLDKYEKRLRHAHLTTGDFAKTMKKFDSPTTWHLLDPPWPDNWSKEYYGKDDLTPAQVAKVAKRMKGTVWVIYNDHPAVKEAFKGFKIYRMHMHGFSPRGGSRPITKLLIVNKPIKR